MATEGLQIGNSLQSILDKDQPIIPIGGSGTSHIDTSLPDSTIDTEASTIASEVATDTASGLPAPIQFREEPSTQRKIAFGGQETTWLLGDLIQLGYTGIKALGEQTWEEAHEELESKRLNKLYTKFPEFKGGHYLNDPAVWGGRVASMMTDPVFYVMPWGWGAKALAQGAKYAKTLRVAKLGTVGAGVGAGYSLVHGTARTGVAPDASDVAMSAALGGILSPVGLGGQKLIGMGLNKIMPNLFKNQKVIRGVMDELSKGFQNKYGLNRQQINKLYSIANNPAIKSLNKEVERLTQTGLLYGKPKLAVQKILRDSTAKLNKKDIVALKRLDLKSLKGKKINTKTVRDNEEKIFKEIDDLFIKSSGEYANAQHKLLVKVMQESYQAGGLTSAFVRALAMNVTRPLFFTGAGATVGALVGEDQEDFNRWMWRGFALGMTHKV